MRRNRRRLLLAFVVLLAAAAAAYFVFSREERLDPRFNGAYRLEDGRLVFVSAREGKTLRYRLMDGESRALWPAGDRRYEAGPGWSGRSPVEVRVAFDPLGPDRLCPGLSWEAAKSGSQRARRIELPEEVFTFASGPLKLRGKLVKPQGEGPFPAVVLVHGSGRESAVDGYFNPYLFAAFGIATLVYDKRGTGESAGEYTQNFHVLARDVLAAVEWLRARPDIDAARIHLAGYSQGGWIAPLAASKTTGIRSLLIGYGPMVPVTGEDRWGYVYALKQKGFGEDAIRKADRINEQIEAIFDHRQDRWKEISRLLDESRGEPWFEAVKGSDSILGEVSESWMPLWVMRLLLWWRQRGSGEPFIDRLYDPVPTLDSLTTTPSLWIFGGEDNSMPTGWTVEKLEALQAKGRPVEFFTFPRADHGILRFEEIPEGRRILGHEPEYLPMMVDWLRRQSDLPPLASSG